MALDEIIVSKYHINWNNKQEQKLIRTVITFEPIAKTKHM